MDNTFNLRYVIDLLYRYRWYLATLCLIAGILAIVFTLPAFYPPEYRSSTIAYPTNPERFDMANIFAEEPAIFLYGDSKVLEKIDNIANQETLKLFIIDSLNLWEEYGVDPANDRSPHHYAIKTFDSRVKTVRVEGNGLEIEAFDTDPQRAADIANLMVARIDEVNKSMLNENKARILEVYHQRERELSRSIHTLTDSIVSLRGTYHIFEEERQTEALLKQLLVLESEVAEQQTRLRMLKNQRASSYQIQQQEAELQAANSKLRRLTQAKSGGYLNLEDFKEGVDKIRSLEYILQTQSLDLKLVNDKIGNLEMMKAGNFSTLMVPGQAIPADKKSRPVRWLILATTLFLTFLLSTLALIYIDRFTTFLQREVPSHE